MPKIHDYQPQQQAPSPVTISSNANDFGAQAYQGAAQAGAGLEDVGAFLEKRATQSEVSDLSAKLSDARAKFTQDLTDGLKTADPGDKDFTQNFMDKYDQYVSQVQDTIQTPGAKNYFERTNEHLRTSLLTSAMAGQTELAGAKETQDLVTLKNSLSTATLANPASFDSSLAQLNNTLDTKVAYGGLTQEAALKVKPQLQKELAESAVLGWAINGDNPKYAKTLLDSGKFDNYVDGEQKQQLYGKITQAENAQAVKRELLAKQQERAVQAAQYKTQNDFLAKLQDGSLDTKTILNSNLDPFGSGSKEQFLKLTQASAQDKVGYTDPGVFRNVFDQITTGTMTNENDLNPYVVNGSISFNDMQKLRGEMQGKRTQQGHDDEQLKTQFVQSVKHDLSHSNDLLNIVDKEGDKRFVDWYGTFLSKWSEARQAGIPAKELTTRGSKNFLGDIQGRGAQEILQGNLQNAYSQQPDPTKTPTVAPAGQPAGPPPASTPPAPAKEKVVNMVDPRGAIHGVPESKVDLAISKYKYKKAN